jgi:hypothetical protein
MASERQIAANRANSRKSAGPKSRAGKARARQNADRHGLAARTPVDANWIEKVEILASEIVNSTAGLVDLAQAGLIASAELEVGSKGPRHDNGHHFADFCRWRPRSPRGRNYEQQDRSNASL